MGLYDVTKTKTTAKSVSTVQCFSAMTTNRVGLYLDIRMEFHTLSQLVTCLYWTGEEEKGGEERGEGRGREGRGGEGRGGREMANRHTHVLI